MSNFETKRAASGESELTPHQRLLAVLEYKDAPDQDGLYKYVVSSICQENGQEAVSGMSLLMEAWSDSEAPQFPADLTLDLATNDMFFFYE